MTYSNYYNKIDKTNTNIIKYSNYLSQNQYFLKLLNHEHMHNILLDANYIKIFNHKLGRLSNINYNEPIIKVLLIIIFIITTLILMRINIMKTNNVLLAIKIVYLITILFIIGAVILNILTPKLEHVFNIKRYDVFNIHAEYSILIIIHVIISLYILYQYVYLSKFLQIANDYKDNMNLIKNILKLIINNKVLVAHIIITNMMSYYAFNSYRIINKLYNEEKERIKLHNFEKINDDIIQENITHILQYIYQELYFTAHKLLTQEVCDELNKLNKELK